MTSRRVWSCDGCGTERDGEDNPFTRVWSFATNDPKWTHRTTFPIFVTSDHIWQPEFRHAWHFDFCVNCMERFNSLDIRRLSDYRVRK